MIEVFKTNVNSTSAQTLLAELQIHFPSCKINFDLEDCDRILRVEGLDFCTKTIEKIVASSNHSCEVLL